MKLCIVKAFHKCLVTPSRFASLGFVRAGGVATREPSAPAPEKTPVFADDSHTIFSDLKDGDKLFIQGASATPSILCSYLHQHVKQSSLTNIDVFHLHPMGPLDYLNEDVNDKIRLSTGFANSYCREAINSGKADIIPISMSEVPLLYRMKHINIDYALISVTPPDKHGFCSLGPAVGSARSAIQVAKKIIGQVNPMLPVTYGDSTIHVSQIDVLVQGAQQPIESEFGPTRFEEQKIATIIAENLVENGATLQLQPSPITRVLTTQLRNHSHLGLHTECFSDGEVDLVNLGVIDNRYKNVRRGRIVGSYVHGTNKVLDFINENPLVALYDIAWTNAPEVIARNPKVTSINIAYEIELSGQSSSDGYGTHIYTGVGGIIDFLRAASLASDGKGKPVLAMTSLTPTGESAIVPYLSRGSGVVATRAHVHYVVTEYGIAFLFGKTLRQRAHALIQIAHPNFRESLEKAAFEHLQCMPTP